MYYSENPLKRAVTTHPAVLKAVIQWIKQFNPAKITVADSAGGLTLGSTDKYLKTWAHHSMRRRRR